MDTRDGFIIGIYNYCDRWCERCALTSRCRVFVEEQRSSFELQTTVRPELMPTLRSLGALAATLEELRPPDLDLPLPDSEPDTTPLPPPPEPSAADLVLEERVRALGRRFLDWLVPEACSADPAVRESAAVLQHFGSYVGVKVYRALRGREACEADGMLSDALGSAKVVLTAFDRLGTAWLTLVERGAISVLEAEPVLAELQALTGQLEALFPKARAFVRPGFDEPTEVAMLEWRERG